MEPYVSVAMLLLLSTAPMFVAVTTPNPVVVALTVCEMPFACTGWPDLTAENDVKGTGTTPLFMPPPPLHAVTDQAATIESTMDRRVRIAEVSVCFITGWRL